MDKKVLTAILLVAILLITNVFWLVSLQGVNADNSKLQDMATEKDTQMSSLNSQILSLQAQETSLTTQYQLLQTSYSSLSGNHTELQCDYDELTSDYLALQSNQTLIYNMLLALQANYTFLDEKYTSLESAYSALDGDKSALQAQYDELVAQYALLSDQNLALQIQYALLQTQYQSHLASYNAVNQQLSYLNMVRLSSLDLDYYMTIREANSILLTQQSKVNFCAALSKHDRGSVYWGSADATYYDIAGYHRYHASWSTELRILNQIEVNDADSSVLKIMKILNFINGNITYKHDMAERYFAPTETLSSGTGDCEDFSILASSMFEMMGVQSAIAFFHNPNGDGHAMVLVHMSNLGGYGNYYYDDLTSLGLASGRWIIIEPQAEIEDQDYSSWFSQWTIEVAAET